MVLQGFLYLSCGMKIRNPYTLISFFIMFACFTVKAQTIGNYYEVGVQLKSPFTIHQISNKDGLPQSEVFRILPIEDRSLILSTGVCPVHYNGFSVKKFLPAPESFYFKMWSIPHKNYVFAINTDDGQLSKVYPQQQVYKSSYAPFFSLVVSGDSLILINKKGLLCSFQPATGLFRPLPLRGPDIHENKFLNSYSFCSMDQQLFLATRDGVFQFDLQKKVRSKIANQAYPLIALDPFSKKLLGLKGKVIYDIFNNEKVIRTLPIKQNNVEPLSICFRDKDDFIVGTSNGLCFMYDDFEEVYDRKSGLPTEYCHALYFDEQQNALFVGTGEKGILKLKFKTNYSFSTAQNFAPGGSIVKRKTGEVIFINGGGEIRRLLSDTSLSYITYHALYGCLAEIKGQLFAGTWGAGVKIFQDTKLIDSIKGNQLHSQQVLACTETKDGSIWVGSVNGVSSGKTVASVQKNEALKIKGEVVCFKELSDGTLCIGTTKGAYFVKNNRIVFQLDNFIKKKVEVRCFYEDRKGRIWMGTYGHGLFVKNGNRISQLAEKKNFMLDKSSFCLVPDDMGYLYSTSNHGLWRIHEESLLKFYEGKLDYLVPFFYGDEEGILNTEFNGGFQNNHLKTKGGHFYFPTMEGLVMTMPEKIITQNIETKLESVCVNDTVFNGDNHVFSRNTYAVRFDFSCTNLSQKANIYFQHKLLGGSSDGWNMPVKSRVVYLSMLPPGTYTFVVRAVSGYNDPNPPQLAYAFEIKPFFYETVWFMVLTILFIIACTTAAVLFRSRSLRKKEEEQKRFSLEVAELKLNAIQAQLNPHFVFNCLNTIKSLILSKDFEKANESLNTFSSLTREMLENSDKIFIPFLQNLKFCKDYIQLEKLRLEDEFTCTLTYDPELNENPLIPHLLIQPYIENAIKHGIAHLESYTGRLVIEFTKYEHGVLCRICDNGIGRVASEKINASRRMHVSKGTTLTQEKSTFLKRYMGYDCKIIVRDVLGLQNEIIGTEVLIKMPFVNESWNN